MFDQLHLTKEASLNRTFLADLPGADPRLVGRRGWEMLRLEVLEELAAQHGIHANQRTEVPRRVGAALGSLDRADAQQARLVIDEFGRRLGHLVATLRLGDELASPWRMAYRHHWRAVDHVWLGGGIVAALGDGLLRSARAEAARLGVDGATLQVAAHADVLALIGAARSRDTPAARALVLDFGYSSVKRGIAGFDHRGALDRLEVLPSFALPRAGLDMHTSAGEVVERLLEVLRTTFHEAQDNQPGDIDAQVVVSLATYICDGRPLPSGELYDRLGEVELASLTARMTEATGVPVHIRFMHDGTSAAAALPSTSTHAGIIVLGTSLGAGFSGPDQPRLPLAADFQVTYQ